MSIIVTENLFFAFNGAKLHCSMSKTRSVFLLFKY